MFQDDADAGLPRPYGDGFDEDENLGNIIEKRLQGRERHRRFWGRLSNVWLLQIARIILPFSYIIVAVLIMAFPNEIDGTLISFCAIFATISFLMPSLASSSYMLWVGQDRIGKRGRRKDGRDSGVGRILNALNEARLHELMRISNQLGYAILLWLSELFPPGDNTRGLLLVIAVLAASVAMVHTILIEKRTTRHSNRLPFLVYHAPSQHQSDLKNTLTEVLEAHLDPESTNRFNHWKVDLESVLLPNIDPINALERILHLIHLEGQGLLARQQILHEFSEFIEEEKIGSMFSSNRHLNAPELSRLMGHTRAWQKSFFRLLDRLQFDLMDHAESLDGRSWRLDASLPTHCAESRGDLFVIVNNLSEIEVPVELEVHVPDGQPSRQSFRLTPNPISPPAEPLPLWEYNQEDVVLWQSRLIDAAHVLWLGVAWADDIEGRRPVRLTLKHTDGRTIRSDTLWTHVYPRSSGGESMRMRMELARNLARRWQTQALIRGE
ncbi:MAG: hypothetical protein QGF94_03010 [Candidatus Thalassarchaeaceae archaeon]|jgi:hypothetical protein|nr:hypothetical protein [Candidatus Thalassarchaeaceae archaeon]